MNGELALGSSCGGGVVIEELALGSCVKGGVVIGKRAIESTCERAVS